jgi:CMP-N-acetylneuraminic acid synthetase
MILGVIPARGGSKGLPRKNILPFCGRPLLAWSIDAAKESKLIDRYIVSTENKEIAQIAQNEGAEVLSRPPELATDEATTIAVLEHVLGHIEADAVVLLQPSCPIRVDNLIDQAIARFRETGVDSLATGYMVKEVAWATHNNLPRQKIEGFFYDDGNIYVHKANFLRQGRWYGDRLERMVIDHHYHFDIDDQIDFWAAEAVLQKLMTAENSAAS